MASTAVIADKDTRAVNQGVIHQTHYTSLYQPKTFARKGDYFSIIRSALLFPDVVRHERNTSNDRPI